MARFLLISIALVAALIIGTNASNCHKCKGQNEEWKKCGACDSTCKNKHVACPLICREPGSCGCKTGYVRDSQKICIKEENCPKSEICGKNEVFYPCGACDQGCNYAARCTTECLEGSCGCKEGYVRNDKRICIPRKCCPKTPICGINEEYKSCGACDQGCDYAVECIQGCREGACGCKSGYLRSNGTCVLSEDCPKSSNCGENEEFYECGACDQGCNYAAKCDTRCREGSCGCKKGYVRNDEKICILQENCQKTPTCGINEEYKPCGACDQGCDYAVDCIQGCRKGACGCKSGYVRSNGTCVLSEDCPKSTSCGENEELRPCGACDGTCKKPSVACTKECRQPECGCKKGYVRNNGTCILLKSCPKTPICGPNEELKGCGACDGTCKEKDVACTLQCREPECGCKSGYVRNNGTCILYEKCPKPCGPHEEIKSCGACDGTCKEPNPACTLDCRPPECGCMKGYVRNNGTCILLKSCPKTPICGPNEELKGCGACDGTCKEKDVMCTADCRPPECGCKSGYVRNNGTCILYEKCPETPTCGPNEEIKGCGACDGTCKEPNPACTKICRQPECGCKKGYVRSNGKCILLKSCPKTPTCGPNEEIKKCGACDGTCKEKDVVCTLQCREPECGCKSGYVRNNGTCILYEKCPKICGPYEEIKSCGACDGTCKEPNPACTLDCRPPECGCMKGYVRNNGTCILLKSCPKTPICGPNEELKGCGACDGTCKEKDVICTADCRPPECGCKSGYVRNNGTCILYEKCPETPTCGPNEEIKGCGACDGTCKEPNPACTKICRQPECGCKKGYVRSNGKCILLKSCPKTPTCGPNEEIKKCGACDGTCKEKDVVCTLQCREPECGCKSGYVRNNGTCILYEKCPKICGPHEEIKSCGACNGTCKEPNPACTLDCRPPECGCMKGYVRNNGTCILLKSCPQTPTCGPNEETKGCGACDGTCENLHPICPEICRQPECGCIKGYVRNNGTCISSDHCLKTPICGQHEEVKPCGACDGTCKKPHKTCTKDCRPPACGCKKGYVRRNKKCVPKSKCPKKCHK